jgi:hypothetical protein
MEERRKSDRRNLVAGEALSPETLALLRLCGASVRAADDPDAVRAGAPVDRRGGSASGRSGQDAPAVMPR